MLLFKVFGAPSKQWRPVNINVEAECFNEKIEVGDEFPVLIFQKWGRGRGTIL